MEFKKNTLSLDPAELESELASLSEALQANPGEFYRVSLTAEDRELLDPGYSRLHRCVHVIEAFIGEGCRTDVLSEECVLIRKD